ncbi:centrosomal protein of 162 kDa-like isoform X1 [Glandiceps talaboti]
MERKKKSFSKMEFDEKFEQFMKESMSDHDDSVDSEAFNQLLGSGRTSARGKSKDLPWWAQDTDEDETPRGTGHSWLKPKKKVEEKKEETPTFKKKVTVREDVGMSKDSLEDQNHVTGASGVLPQDKPPVGLSSDMYSEDTMTSTGRDHGPSPGAETLEEAADKERFFKELEEKEGTKHIDYGKLNKETDLSGTLGTLHGSRTLAGIEEKDEDVDSTSQNTEERRVVDSHSPKDDKKPGSGGMLAKVSLLDSMDSSLGTIKLPGSHDDKSSNKGLLDAGTATEMEALHGLLQKAVLSPTMKLDDTGTGSDGLMKEVKAAYRASLEAAEREDEMDGDGIIAGSIKDTTDLNRMNQKSDQVSQMEKLGRTQTIDKPKKQPRTIRVTQPRTRSSKIPTKTAGKKDSKKDLKKDVKKDTSKKDKDKYKHVKSSDYGAKKGWSPADAVQQKIKGSETISLAPKPYDTQLLASVESFAHYIKDHFVAEKGKDKVKGQQDEDEYPLTPSKQPRDSQIQQLSRERALLAEVQDWQRQWKEEHKHNQKMRAEIISLQRTHERELEELRLQHENDIFRIKQENMILIAKLNNEEQGETVQSGVKDKLANVKDSAEKIGLMEKEMQHQETLLEGYHQENKRLYKEIQELKKEGKESEQKWKAENLKLRTDITYLRDNLDETGKKLKNKGVITSIEVQRDIAAGTGTAILGAGQIAQLKGELQEAQVSEIELKQKIKSLDANRSDLEKHVEVLVKERKDAESRVLSMIESKAKELNALNKEHEKHTESLQKKLKWYAENQDLLDKDTKALQEKNDEIKSLKDQLQHLQQEKDEKRKVNETQRRARERAADAKKIQDLERQIKEMENILRKRHPNSLPALIYAAATAPTDTSKSPSKSQARTFLEERVHKLENELDEREVEAKRSLRTMEQRYNSMKYKFEEHINTLEKELDGFKRADGNAEHPHTHMVALERELKSVRERYQKEVEDLRAKLDFVQRNSKGKLPSQVDNRSLEGRLEVLEDELRNKDAELIQLKLKYQSLESNDGGLSNGDRRHYKPREFAGMHISDVMQENDRLKSQVERMSFELDQQRVQLQKSVAEAESGARKVTEDAEDRMSMLKISHESEIQRLIMEHANKLTDSQVSYLNSQINAQQVMISHLKEQVTKYKSDADKLAASEIQGKAGRQQIDLLTQELREAKKSHTPEMRHFEALQTKITSLETRYLEREQELQNIVAKATMVATAEKDEEILYYKQQLREKNVELQKFRTELDTLLGVIRELQHQGVVLHGQTAKSLLH